MFLIFALILNFASAKKTLPKRFLKEPEQPPHFGGQHSKEAVLVVVTFSYVPGKMEFRQMVESLQAVLLTGGIQSNAFRPKKPSGKQKERPKQVMLYVDSLEKATEAKMYLEALEEVKKVEIQTKSEVEVEIPTETTKNDL